MFSNSPGKVVVIAGTTGVGKSQLSIHLAKKFNGEVINSDSMQVYKGLPIITNKHPIGEREGIPHHVINHVDWSEEYYLHRFENECINAIEDIHRRGKLAIIVGGTHYYLQVLFNKHLKSAKRDITKEERELLNSGNGQLIYDTLKVYDPEIATKFHPNDTRRVQRMLEIYYESGKKPSETYAEQEISLRYNTLFLWLYSDLSTLERRLDDRVDKMLETGAMQEIMELYDYFRNHRYTTEQCENGVWQVIGFKEFLPWLTDEAKNIKVEESVERMKIRTRQYAKKQVKWIRKMLIPDVNGDVYVLDASDLSQWHENVLIRSSDITRQFFEDKPVQDTYVPERLKGILNMRNPKDKSQRDWKQYMCSICRDQHNKELIAIGETNWQIHLKSRRHRSNLTKGARKAAYEKWKVMKNMDDDARER
ncbi:tRNA isopentenyltransferase [Zygosaccharomyces mellis]|uniref:tRNA dimethylallyltransferase n=1 Tax=Zygosaccharomyces mellis TaxID=42258 RepID=A0A4C2E6B7_9SACH|nr:tRNA isopentenyltransferase [Zygosaccharomyces mellis]